MKKLKNLGLTALALLIVSCLGVPINKETKKKFDKYRKHYSCIVQNCFKTECVEQNKQKCTDDLLFKKKESQIVCYELQCNPSPGSLENYQYDGCVDWCANSPDSPDDPGSLHVRPQAK